MQLVDTSVWVDHLRQGDRELAEALQRGQVMSHPAVISELALGHLKERKLPSELGVVVDPRSTAPQGGH